MNTSTAETYVPQDLSTLEVTFEEHNGTIEDVRPVAQGSFAAIYQHHFRGHPVAYKVFKNVNNRYTVPELKAMYFSEISMLSLLRHENIVGLVGYQFVEANAAFAILLEWVNGSDLHRFIHVDQALPRLNGSTILDMGYQIAQGMAYLHQNNVVHKDLKTNNIMYDYFNNKIKIIDFGMAKLDKFSLRLNGEKLEPKEKHNIKYWNPPEVCTPIRGQEYTSKSDVFSYGIVLYELFVGEYAYNPQVFRDNVECMSNVIQDIQHNLSILTPSPGIRGYIEVNNKLPNEVRDLIISCIHLDPTLRINFSKAQELLRCMHNKVVYEETRTGVARPPYCAVDYMTDIQVPQRLPADVYLPERLARFVANGSNNLNLPHFERDV